MDNHKSLNITADGEEHDDDHGHDGGDDDHDGDHNEDHDNDVTRFEIIIRVRPRAPAGLAASMRSGSTIRRPSLTPVDVHSLHGQSAPRNRDHRVYRGKR